MGTLYLDRKNLALKLDGQALALYENDSKQGTVPLSQIERVVIRGNVQLESRILGALTSNNIGLLVLSGRNTEATAMLSGRAHSDAQRRIGQYFMANDLATRLPLAKWLVLAKIRNQRQLLSRAHKDRLDLRHDMTKGIECLSGILTMLDAPDVVPDLASLRGYEGAAAAAFFGAYAQLFAPSLNFIGRKKRPPPDPVNVCLSLGYTLLHYDTVRACHLTGLDPMLGFYHDIKFGRESLACDLMEPLRPWLDEWVWQVFRDRSLRTEHFSMEQGRCQMNKTGRQIFYGCYEQRVVPVRRLLRRYAYALAMQLQKGVS